MIPILTELIQNVLDCTAEAARATDERKRAEQRSCEQNSALIGAYGALRPMLPEGQVVVYRGNAVWKDSRGNVEILPVVSPERA